MIEIAFLYFYLATIKLCVTYMGRARLLANGIQGIIEEFEGYFYFFKKLAEATTRSNYML